MPLSPFARPPKLPGNGAFRTLAIREDGMLDRRRFAALSSAAVVGSSPEEPKAHLAAEMAKWGTIIAEAGIKVE